MTPKAKRTDLPQVDDLIQAAKTTVVFIDDHRTVRPNETGSTQLILETAERILGAPKRLRYAPD